MTVDISNKGKYVFYLNFREIGNRQEDKFCESEQFFKQSQLLEKADEYILSVERFKIPIQSVPMLDSILAAIQLVPKTAVALQTYNSVQTFSLYDFLISVNSFYPGFILSVSPDGRFVIDFDGFDDYSILLDTQIADVFDMDQSLGLAFTGSNRIIGGSCLFDRFDQLSKIQINSLLGLSGVQQEIINTDVFKNLLTDFLVPTTYDMSFGGEMGIAPNSSYNLVYNTRQDLNFNASSNRRFIMIRSSAPIQNVKISVDAVLRSGEIRRIPLPPRSIFELKLAFWKK